MRKFSTIILVCLLCLSMLFATACGKEPVTSGDVGATNSGFSSDPDNSNAVNLGDDITSDGTTDSSNDASADSSNTSPSGGSVNPTGNSQGGNATTKGNSGGKVTTTTTKYVKDTKIRDLKGRTLVYTVYWDEPEKGSSPTANKYWKNKEQVEKDFNCKIQYKFMNRNDIDNLVIPSILAGDPIADVFGLKTDRMYNYAKKGLLYPLDTLKQFDFSEDKWNAVAPILSEYKGHFYGMYISQRPYFGGAFLYNKDLFASKKLDDPFELMMQGKKVWNWDTFRRLCNEVTGGDTYGVGHYSIHADGLMMFAGANGASLIKKNEDGTFRSSVADKAMINAISFYQTLKTDGVIGPIAGLDTCKERFLDGKLGFIDNTWEFFSMAEQADFNMGLVLKPAGPDTDLEYGVQFSCEFQVMPSCVKDPEAVAAVFDRYLGTESDADNWEDIWYDMFGNEEVIETMKLSEKLLKEGKHTPAYDYLPDIYELGLFGVFNSLANAQMTPAQGLESMMSVIQKEVDELNAE